MAEKQDITLKCIDCGKDFVYRVKDQIFFEEHQYSPPKRCFDCRQLKKLAREQSASAPVVEQRREKKPKHHRERSAEYDELGMYQ